MRDKLRNLRRFVFPTRSQKRYIRLAKDHGGMNRHRYSAENPETHRLFRRWPERHFVTIGEQFGHSPDGSFDAAEYSQRSGPIAEGIAPFEHFLAYGRKDPQPQPLQALPPAITNPHAKREIRQLTEGKPLVSVIVPNFNHEAFLAERIDTILHQTYENLELLILDDRSTDNSRAVIDRYVSEHSGRVRAIYNDTNSGNVFKQWRRGIEAAQGDLVWICESDDLAEPDFLERVVPSFSDPAVTLAFGRVQFCDASGSFQAGLDNYREFSEPGVWGGPRHAPAATWFRTAFSVHNVIPNVGGCVFKQGVVDPSTWNRAEEFDILGDWFLYLNIARGGKIAWVPGAVTYFRQHGANTSVRSFETGGYYEEHEAIASAIRAAWPVDPFAFFRFHSQLESQFSRVGQRSSGTGEKLYEHFSLDRTLSTERNSRHILIGFLGFHVGGGEYLPMHLANELVAQGHLVSMLQLDDSVFELEMYEQLDRRVPVYHADDVRRMGVYRFMEDACIDVVNSHHIGTEGLLFLELGGDPERLPPVVSSLHGTYEVSDLEGRPISDLASSVSAWIYTADKNLAHLRARPWIKTPQHFVPNAVPAVVRGSLERADLGLEEGDFVYTLISRPIKEKGWEIAVQAIERVAELSGRGVQLLLVGDGWEREELEETVDPGLPISFLGYRSDAADILAISDVCLLPTRFVGESYPLILIQAASANVPSIATRAGHIPDLLSTDCGIAGILLDWNDDDDLFTEALAAAMIESQNPRELIQMRNAAASVAAKHSISRMGESYLEVLSKAESARAEAAHEELQEEVLGEAVE